MKKSLESMSRAELLERNRFLEQFYAENAEARSQFKERVKELKCIYGITRSIVENDQLDHALQQIVQIIPQGWQFPDKTYARLELNKQKYLSTPFEESRYFLKEIITVDSEGQVGTLEVFCHEDCSDFGEGPFLSEERDLIGGIANIVSLLVKQHQVKQNKDIIKQQLLHAERLATVGQLSAGVAHEINEPLTNILGFAQLIIKEGELSDNTKNDLNRIEQAALYARNIIRKLMQFSRQTVPQVSQFDLSAVVEDTLSFLEVRFNRKGIELVKSFGRDIFLYADSDQIKQVVTNLVINAIQAMRSGGQLIVETIRENDNAIIVVSDTGEGISDKDISKIFMPFYTTKDVGEGTGLGLSVVYGIVKSFSGNIKVSSCIGRGTRFDVIFPLKKESNF